MSAINFPLIVDISSATNDVSSQGAGRLPGGAAGLASFQSDTVTLSAVFPPAPAVDGANLAEFQTTGQQPALQGFPPPPPAPSPDPAGAPIAQVVESGNVAAPTTLSQQEQLAQLDSALEQLGINPQSISLDNRLALLKSANDPPKLLNLVRALGSLAGSAAATLQSAVLSGNNLSNPVPAGVQPQVPAQTESQAQAPTPSTNSFQGSSPPAESGFETNLQASGAQSIQTPLPAINSATAAAQFQELQAIFQNAENSQASGTAPDSVGQTSAPSLSILA
jgi:hypothetical protein